MAAFFLWCILLVLCWPLALVALIFLSHCVATAASVSIGGHCGDGRA